VSHLITTIVDKAPSLHAALTGGYERTEVIWLPGKAHAPLPSPELIWTTRPDAPSR
jgi:hypothetical protein